MESVRVPSQKTSFTTAISETFSQMTEDWASSGLNVCLYAVPLLGFGIKVTEAVCRFFDSTSGLIDAGKKSVYGSVSPMGDVDVAVITEAVRKETRKRQSNDAMYVIGALVSLVVFSGLGFAPVGVLLSALVPTIFFSVMLYMHTQTHYGKALEQIQTSALYVRK